MSNGNGKIDWSTLYKNEDWWACWIGWFVVILAIPKIMPHVPKIGKWATLADAFPHGWGTFGEAIVLLILIGVLTSIGAAAMKKSVKKFIPGFVVIFALSFLAMFISSQLTIKTWGIAYVIWALAFGLFISNALGVPEWLKSAVETEFFIKIGLVIMGQRIMFSTVIEAGAVGVAQAILVAGFVWFMTYWICRKFKVSERFSSIIATANSICGVSASIAAGGAIRGDPKEVSYMVAWLMICAVVLILVMPPIARWMDLPTNMGGAWVGGVIDNTGAVVAAGEIIGSEASLKAAAMVKMAQNVLIGFAAFFLALWATLSLDVKEGMAKPSLAEVWYRFPKFIVGFIVSSFIISFIVIPGQGQEAADAMHKLCKGYRKWFFTIAFVCIGLETRVKDLITVGGGRPAIAYWISQILNAFWTLLIVWILWSGTFFTPAILPD